MSTRYCRHIKSNGRRCFSLAVRQQPFCYFHRSMNERLRAINPPPDPTPTIIHPMQHDADYLQRNPLVAQYYGIKPAGPLELDFPVIEDRESIQVALSMLLSALGRNRLDPKRAGMMLYSLQVASSNAAKFPDQRTKVVCETVLDENGLELAPDEDPEDDEGPRKLSSAERLLIEISGQDCDGNKYVKLGDKYVRAEDHPPSEV